jgi:hypothetical protein
MNTISILEQVQEHFYYIMDIRDIFHHNTSLIKCKIYKIIYRSTMRTTSRMNPNTNIDTINMEKSNQPTTVRK